jgi:hypothetical protein
LITNGENHRITFAVRGIDPGDVRQKLFHHSIGYHPVGERYSLNGGLGHGSASLDEYSIVSIRKSRARGGVRVWSTLSLCTDCMLVCANGECGERPSDLSEPLCLVAGEDVVLGADEHRDGCTESDRAEGCDGCDNWNHGDRFAAAILRPVAGKHWVERV